MSGTTTIAIGRNMRAFAKKEAVPGTLVIPAAADMIVLNSAELQVPAPQFEEDKGVRASRSVFNRYNVRTPGAPFKLQHYVRPSGTAGNAPEADCVFESAFGKKTVVGATSVAYDPDNTQPSFSLYVKKDHTVYAAAGCVVDKFGMKKDNKGMLEASEDGKGFRVLWTGTGLLGKAISTVPAADTEEEYEVDDPKKWCTGSHIIIDTEQFQVTGTAWEGTAAATKIKLKRGYNSSTPALHGISSVAGVGNTGNGVLSGVAGTVASLPGNYVLTCTATAPDGGTFSVVGPGGALPDATVGTPYVHAQILFTINDGAIDFDIDDTFTITITALKAITPWLPTGTETGAPIAARVGTMTLDGVTTPFLDIDYNLENSITQNDDEVTGTATPTDYFEGDRKVTGSLNLFFRKADVKWFADAIKQTRKAVIINYGSVAGSKIAITNGYCEFDMPAYSGDKEVMKLAVKYMAYGSAGNDETQLKFL